MSNGLGHITLAVMLFYVAQTPSPGAPGDADKRDRNPEVETFLKDLESQVKSLRNRVETAIRAAKDRHEYELAASLDPFEIKVAKVRLKWILTVCEQMGVPGVKGRAKGIDVELGTSSDVQEWDAQNRLQSFEGAMAVPVAGDYREIRIRLTRTTAKTALATAWQALRDAEHVPPELVSRQKKELREYYAARKLVNKAHSLVREAKQALYAAPGSPGSHEAAMTEWKQKVEDSIEAASQGLANVEQKANPTRQLQGVQPIGYYVETSTRRNKTRYRPVVVAKCSSISFIPSRREYHALQNRGVRIKHFPRHLVRVIEAQRFRFVDKDGRSVRARHVCDYQKLMSGQSGSLGGVSTYLRAPGPILEIAIFYPVSVKNLDRIGFPLALQFDDGTPVIVPDERLQPPPD